MFFGDYQILDIAEVLNVDIDTIKFYIFGEDGSGNNKNCWYQMKKELAPTSVAIYIKDKVKALEKTAGVAHGILAKSLMDLSKEVEDGKELSIADMKDLASIVTSIDKIVRLETGKPTEVHEFVTLSVNEAKHVLANDPFFQAEYKVLENKEEDLEGDVQIKSPWNT